MSEIIIRTATLEDAKDLLEIYAPYVKNTAITFEYEVPSEEEFKKRIEYILEKYPYLVAENKGEIVGYAYASSFHSRAAYQWGAETSIYVKENQRNLGVGKSLYNELERILKLQNILNLNACIAYPETEDEQLTKNSVQFHQHLGNELVGEFDKCGYKFNRWYNMVWMEKHIGDHLENPMPIIPFCEIKKGAV